MESNNCQNKNPDCFNKNGLKQLGVNPYNQPPTMSEIAFDNRYAKSGGKRLKRLKRKYSRTKKGGRGRVNISSPASYSFDFSDCNYAIVKPTSQNCGTSKQHGGKKSKPKKTKKNKKTNKKTKTNKKKGGGIGYRLNLNDCGMAEVSPYTTKCGQNLVSSNCKNNH